MDIPVRWLCVAATSSHLDCNTQCPVVCTWVHTNQPSVHWGSQGDRLALKNALPLEWYHPPKCGTSFVNIFLHDTMLCPLWPQSYMIGDAKASKLLDDKHVDELNKQIHKYVGCSAWSREDQNALQKLQRIWELSEFYLKHVPVKSRCCFQETRKGRHAQTFLGVVTRSGPEVGLFRRSLTPDRTLGSEWMQVSSRLDES